MQSINFNTGSKEYAINGDDSNTIRINVSDINIMTRINEVQEKLDSIGEKLTENGTPTPELLSECDREIKQQIDYAFGSNVSQAVFGCVNCLSPVDGGKLLFEAFMDAFIPLVAGDIKARTDAQRTRVSSETDKYTAHLNQTIKEDKPVQLTDEQRQLLELFDKRQKGEL